MPVVIKHYMVRRMGRRRGGGGARQNEISDRALTTEAGVTILTEAGLNILTET